MRLDPRPAIVQLAQTGQSLRAFAGGQVAAPPPRVKRRQLLRLFQQGGHRLFVESGTYRGDTVAYFQPHAERIVSVEVEPALHAAATERFAADPSVEILLGDGIELIPPLLADRAESTLLFLDGHFSGGATGQGVEAEPAASILERIAGAERRAPLTVVVDDLRLFGVEQTFPTLDALLASARAGFPHARIYAALDALVIRG